MATKTTNDGNFQTLQISSISDSSTNSRTSNDKFLLQAVPSKNENMPDQDPNRTRNRWLRVEFVINMLNHVLIGFVTIYLSWMCLRVNLQKTALHAWLCTIGFSCLMAEGVMTHYNANAFLFTYKRKTKTTVHWILQALGGTLGIAGSIVKITEKEVHFTSIHGKLGLASIIFCGLSMMSGLSALYSYSSTLRKLFSPLLNKTVHNILGVTAFVLALLTQYYGYETGFFRNRVDVDFRVMMQVITLTSLVLSCWGPLNALWDKFRHIV